MGVCNTASHHVNSHQGCAHQMAIARLLWSACAVYFNYIEYIHERVSGPDFIALLKQISSAKQKSSAT